MATQWIRRLATAAFAASLFVTGCSQDQGSQVETGSLTVKVTDGNQALSRATVRLISVNGQAGSIADLDDTGSAQFKEIEVGEYRVAIFPASEGDPIPDAPPSTVKPVKIPAKFQDESQTPLRASVAKGETEATFDLQKK